MKIIVVGCGRVGAGLTRALSLRGHAITVVDRDPTAFERLGPLYKGETITGTGIDRDVLVKAGIERADGLASVTASDETNVVVARIAKEVFGVPRIVARVYDPQKAEIYRRLGLQIISPVAWGINQIADLLCYSSLDMILSLGSGGVNIAEAEIPLLLVGRTVDEVTVLGDIHVVAISREGRVFLPTLGTVFKEGDSVYFVLSAESSDRLQALLGIS
jgi:trk system potassium uptake protein TrkA